MVQISDSQSSVDTSNFDEARITGTSTYCTCTVQGKVTSMTKRLSHYSVQCTCLLPGTTFVLYK